MPRQKPMTLYRVYWRDPEYCDSGDEYIEAASAQHAVDQCRQHCMPDGAEVVEVAKVVKNWK